MSFLRRLFGGGAASDAPAKPARVAEHEGYVIRATPFQENGQWQTCGLISKDVGGELREHRFIRADRFPSQEMAADHAIVKAKQIIDQQGDRLFD
ncbi:MAG: hypothetical protein KF694_16530 [Mesorhizobium sp.]|nr:hypothetical protein [Mesorhizobium sp.]